MDEARKKRLMAYCRIDELGPDDEVVLAGMYEDAVAYLVGAGVAVPESGTSRAAQFDARVDELVLDALDNRGTQTAGYALTENPAFRRKLNQLKLTEPEVTA